MKNFIPSSTKASLEFLELPDCINLSEHGHCQILNVSKCAGEECPFKLTKEEAFQNEQRWAQRLSSLDTEKQNKIAKKYYRGNNIWKDTFQGGK